MTTFAFTFDAECWASTWADGPASVKVAGYHGMRPACTMCWPFDWSTEGWEDKHFGWQWEHMEFLRKERGE